MDPIIATIQIFGFNFAPRGWMFCNGQIISIAQNSAVFALIGTTYGGDGMSTFALPDFRGRAPLHMGQGAGLPSYVEGQSGGTTSVTLTLANLPAHTHISTLAVGVANGAPTAAAPAGEVLTNAGSNFYAAAGTADGHYGAASATIAVAGSNAPFSIEEPYLALNFCFCMEGVFPSRN